MTTYDVDNMGLEDLKALKKSVDKALDTFEQRRLNAARKELEEKAKELGVSLSEVVGATKKGTMAPKVAAKYQNPSDSSQTWSGRGRQPVWYREAIEAGKTPEDLAL